MEFAKEIGKPVVFHCREAYPELLSFIERWMESHGAVPCLFHCFAGDATDASRAVALDCYFGVDGPITYAKADALRQVVAGLPRDRVVLETDSPYMAPVPYRGKPNRPSHLPHIALKLGEMWGVSSDTVSDVTTANARRFFGI